jgi:hypothetical protein
MCSFSRFYVNSGLIENSRMEELVAQFSCFLANIDEEIGHIRDWATDLLHCTRVALLPQLSELCAYAGVRGKANLRLSATVQPHLMFRTELHR